MAEPKKMTREELEAKLTELREALGDVKDAYVDMINAENVPDDRRMAYLERMTAATLKAQPLLKKGGSNSKN